MRGQLSFSQFNIDKILTHGASLLGSEGVEYDAQELGESFAACNSINSFVKTFHVLIATHLMLDPNNKELIAKQKQLLNKRLGLDVAEGLGITGDEELFKEEDLLIKSEKNVSLTAHVS